MVLMVESDRPKLGQLLFVMPITYLAQQMTCMGVFMGLLTFHEDCSMHDTIVVRCMHGMGGVLRGSLGHGIVHLAWPSLVQGTVRLWLCYLRGSVTCTRWCMA